jgi:hypothetical protein
MHLAAHCFPVTVVSAAAAAAGKDYRDSVLKDAKTSLIVIAGGDPDLRQAVTDGEVKQVGEGGVSGLCRWVTAGGWQCKRAALFSQG